MSTVKHKRCIKDGCCKLASKTVKSEYCDTCLDEIEEEETVKDFQEEALSELEAIEDEFMQEVKLLEEVEAEKWARFDSDVRACLLNQRNKELEMRVAELVEQERRRLVHEEELKKQRNFNSQQAAKKIELDKIVSKVKEMKEKYQKLTAELAEKYEVELTKMSIDPDTRVIKEFDLP